MYFTTNNAGSDDNHFDNGCGDFDNSMNGDDNDCFDNNDKGQ